MPLPSLTPTRAIAQRVLWSGAGVGRFTDTRPPFPRQLHSAAARLVPDEAKYVVLFVGCFHSRRARRRGPYRGGCVGGAGGVSALPTKAPKGALPDGDAAVNGIAAKAKAPRLINSRLRSFITRVYVLRQELRQARKNPQRQEAGASVMYRYSLPGSSAHSQVLRFEASVDTRQVRPVHFTTRPPPTTRQHARAGSYTPLPHTGIPVSPLPPPSLIESSDRRTFLPFPFLLHSAFAAPAFSSPTPSTRTTCDGLRRDGRLSAPAALCIRRWPGGAPATPATGLWTATKPPPGAWTPSCSLANARKICSSVVCETQYSERPSARFALEEAKDAAQRDGLCALPRRLRSCTAASSRAAPRARRGSGARAPTRAGPPCGPPIHHPTKPKRSTWPSAASWSCSTSSTSRAARRRRTAPDRRADRTPPRSGRRAAPGHGALRVGERAVGPQDRLARAGAARCSSRAALPRLGSASLTELVPVPVPGVRGAARPDAPEPAVDHDADAQSAEHSSMECVGR